MANFERALRILQRNSFFWFESVHVPVDTERTLEVGHNFNSKGIIATLQKKIYLISGMDSYIDSNDKKYVAHRIESKSRINVHIACR